MKTILCYGDSNTYGTKPIDINLLEIPFEPTYYRYPKDKRWTGILQKELGGEFEVIEEGLNGRTTVFDDPVEGIHKNGLTYLVPCLESHAPIDLVILMLGTNDLKKRFSLSAFDIAFSVGVLVKTIQASKSGPNGTSPKVLILCPPPLGKLTYFEDLFDDGIEQSKNLAQNYKKIANLYGCSFMDVGEIIKPSDIDGVHYDEEDVAKLGKEVARMVKKIFS
jgi:lysophospholipase L1-like esterase